MTISRWIDAINERIGQFVAWAILLAVTVSVLNAFGRKFMNLGSNAWLELQWYLFGGLFLLSSGYTLLKNGHVRVDVLSSRLTKRTQIKIDLFGTLFFLFPTALIIMVLGWPMFWESWDSQEMSSNSGGFPLAGQVAGAGGFLPADSGRRITRHQVHLLPSGARAGPDETRFWRQRGRGLGR